MSDLTCIFSLTTPDELESGLSELPMIADETRQIPLIPASDCIVFGETREMFCPHPLALPRWASGRWCSLWSRC